MNRLCFSTNCIDQKKYVRQLHFIDYLVGAIPVFIVTVKIRFSFLKFIRNPLLMIVQSRSIVVHHIDKCNSIRYVKVVLIY